MRESRLYQPKTIRFPGTLLAVALLGSNTWALDSFKQISQYQQSRWDNRNGLPQNSAFAIAQTRDGYIWAGTEEGLVRFDGLRFTVWNLRNTPQLIDQNVQRLLAAPDGTLWGATLEALFRFEGGQFRMISGRDQPCAKAVQALALDAAGTVWTGNEAGQVCSFGQPGLKLVHQFRSKAGVRSLLAMPDGTLWAGTDDGLWSFRSRWRRFGTQEGLPSSRVGAVLRRRDGTLLIGTAEGMASTRDGARFGPLRLSIRLQSVTALLEDRNGNIWAACRRMGLYRYTPSGDLSRYNDPGPDSVARPAALHEDREGGVWIGTYGDGLRLLHDARITRWTAREGISDSIAWAVLEDADGAIFTATDKEGVRKLRRGRPEAVPALGEPEATALHRLGNGDLLCGLPRGLARLAGGQWRKWKLPAHAPCRGISVFLDNPDGSLWLGTMAGGLYRMRDGALIQDPTFPDPNVLTLVRTRSGQVLAGTSGHGLLTHSPSGWVPVKTQSPLPGTEVFAILERENGDLWVSTASAGLSRIRAGVVASVSARQGLPSPTNFAMVEDGLGALWLSSNIGIARVSLRDLDAVADGAATSLKGELFGLADGMANPECSGASMPAAIRDRAGVLWFPTQQGVVSIDPQNWRKHPPAPPVVLEAATYGGGLSPVGQTLPVGQRDLELRFSLPTFIRPDLAPVRYRLTGYDERWTESINQRTVRYTNLPAGSYQLEIQAANADGVWRGADKLISFEVPPRFTETIWWWITLAGCGSLTGVGLFYWRMRQVREREERLERLVAERTAEARNAARAKAEFLANMSHEIRTPMNAVVGTTDILSGMDLPPVAQEHIATIRASGDSLLSIINDILDFSKIESGKLELERRAFSLVDCIEGALAVIKVVAGPKGLVLEDIIDPAVPEVLESDSTRLRQILLNLLSNAVKFTPSGSVTLHVRPAEGGRAIHFEVRDTGIGISPEAQQKLFREFSQADSSTTRRFGGTGLGLAISKKLTEAFGGKIWVESEPGQGTRFHFTIAMPSSSEAAVAPGRESGAILLVSEDPTYFDSVVAKLRRLGAADFSVCGPAEALALCQHRQFPHVFVDEQSALSVEATIRALVRHCGAEPVIVRRSHSSPPMATPPLATALSLTKPVSMADLRRALGLQTEKTESGQALNLAEELPLRILVAEDNAVNQRVVLSLLGRLGYQAQAVGSGREALLRLAAEPFDLILMDVHMPEMDGLEATKRIRSEHQHQPKVLALTASAFSDDRAACLAAGMDGFLSKPLRLEELQQALSAAFQAGKDMALPGRST